MRKRFGKSWDDEQKWLFDEIFKTYYMEKILPNEVEFSLVGLLEWYHLGTFQWSLCLDIWEFIAANKGEVKKICTEENLKNKMKNFMYRGLRSALKLLDPAQ